MSSVKAKPDGYHSITPYLIVSGGPGAIEFYKGAFGATEMIRIPGPHGRVGHAALRLGDSVLMLADEQPQNSVLGPKTLGGSPVHLMLYVDHVDDVAARAVEAGATLLKPVADQFYGDRTATLEDPYGHQWTVATHTEDVAPEELKRRAEAVRPG